MAKRVEDSAHPYLLPLLRISSARLPIGQCGRRSSCRLITPVIQLYLEVWICRLIRCHARILKHMLKYKKLKHIIYIIYPSAWNEPPYIFQILVYMYVYIYIYIYIYIGQLHWPCYLLKTHHCHSKQYKVFIFLILKVYFVSCIRRLPFRRLLRRLPSTLVGDDPMRQRPRTRQTGYRGLVRILPIARRRRRRQQAGADDLLALPDARAREGVPLQPLPDRPSPSRNLSLARSHRAADQDLVPEPAHEVEARTPDDCGRRSSIGRGSDQVARVARAPRRRRIRDVIRSPCDWKTDWRRRRCHVERRRRRGRILADGGKEQHGGLRRWWRRRGRDWRRRQRWRSPPWSSSMTAATLSENPLPTFIIGWREAGVRLRHIRFRLTIRWMPTTNDWTCTYST